MKIVLAMIIQGFTLHVQSFDTVAECEARAIEIRAMPEYKGQAMWCQTQYLPALRPDLPTLPGLPNPLLEDQQ